jgi:hypothetical protein
MVAFKLTGFLLKHFNSRGLQNTQLDALDNWESRSMLQFPVKVSTTLPAHPRSSGQLQLSSLNFSQWLRDNNHFTLFFDGVSKGTPGRHVREGFCMALQDILCALTHETWESPLITKIKCMLSYKDSLLPGLETSKFYQSWGTPKTL